MNEKALFGKKGFAICIAAWSSHMSLFSSRKIKKAKKKIKDNYTSTNLMYIVENHA